MSALYQRTLHLAQASYPWLGVVAEPAKAPALGADLKASIECQGPGEAVAAGTHFLLTFADLLITLIGEALSTRLLHSAWSDGESGTTTQESQA